MIFFDVMLQILAFYFIATQGGEGGRVYSLAWLDLPSHMIENIC